MQLLDPLNCKQISKFFSPYLTAADEGVTGTSDEKRNEFQRLIRDCKRGKIDRMRITMKEKYTAPEMEIVEFDSEDVITSSNQIPELGE